MKAVLILALLALAANSFSLNLTAFSLGEANTIGLTEEQLQFDAIPCIQAITNDIDQGLALLETRDFLTILGGFNSWYAQFQTDFHVICQNYTNDVKEIFVSNLNLSVPVEVTIKENLKTYAPEIIQQLDFLINNITTGNDFEAGVSDVTITRILYGLTVPTVPAVTPFNASLYTMFNLSTFSSEYFPAFFAGIGNTAVVDSETLGQCLSDIETITQGIEYFIHDFRSYSVIEKIGAIITFASAGANGVESCKYGLDLYATVYGPIYEAFKAEPVKFILEVVNNMAANAPEIVQSLQQEEIYILQGQYDLAGETKADRFLTVFGFALNI